MSAELYNVISDFDSFIVFFGIIIAGLIIERYRVKKLTKSSHAINAYLGAPFAPRLHRQLTQKELSHYSYFRVPSSKYKIVISLLLIVSIIIITIDLYMSFKIIILGIITTICLLMMKNLSNKQYLDIVAPVMKIVGPLSYSLNMNPFFLKKEKDIECISFYAGKEDFYIDVSEEDKINPESFYSVLKNMKEDELIEVEYTAHTKNVLSVNRYIKQNHC